MVSKSFSAPDVEKMTTPELFKIAAFPDKSKRFMSAYFDARATCVNHEKFHVKNWLTQKCNWRQNNICCQYDGFSFLVGHFGVSVRFVTNDIFYSGNSYLECFYTVFFQPGCRKQRQINGGKGKRKHKSVKPSFDYNVFAFCVFSVFILLSLPRPSNNHHLSPLRHLMHCRRLPLSLPTQCWENNSPFHKKVLNFVTFSTLQRGKAGEDGKVFRDNFRGL